MYKTLILIALVLLFVSSCAKDNTKTSKAKNTITHTKEIDGLKDEKNLQDLKNKLEQKRQNFQEVDKIHDRYHWSNKSDKLSADEKKNRTKLWFNASQKRDVAYREYIPVILEYWAILPESSNENLKAQEELKQAIADVGYNKNTESEMNQKNTLADLSWSFLATGKINKQKAAFLSTLIEPPKGVRISDRMHAFGIPIEPYGWDLQLAYSLALIRAEKADLALKELKKVESKVLKYQKRSNQEMHSKDFTQKKSSLQEAIRQRYVRQTQQLQVCELLHALVALQGKDLNKAETYYKAAHSHGIVLNDRAKALAASSDFQVLKKD